VSAYMCGHHLHTGGHVTEVHTLAQRVEAIAERLAMFRSRSRRGTTLSPPLSSPATIAGLKMSSGN